MNTLPHDSMGLLLMVFVLGLKHGMDPDHLVTIDGLTRYNGARLGRWTGVLFALGHGLVVTAAAGLLAWTGTEWRAPVWLEGAGTWISIVLLLLLGGVNLVAVFGAAPNQVIRPVGLKARWFRRFIQIDRPLLIVGVGALFAASFDTFSQAALFSVTATSIMGWPFAAVLGVVFMFGMMATDGINGVWVARLLRRADRTALVASRTLSLAIAALSIAVALLGIAEYFSVAAATRVLGRELFVGAATIVILGLSFYLSMRRVRAVRNAS